MFILDKESIVVISLPSGDLLFLSERQSSLWPKLLRLLINVLIKTGIRAVNVLTQLIHFMLVNRPDFNFNQYFGTNSSVMEKIL